MKCFDASPLRGATRPSNHKKRLAFFTSRLGTSQEHTSPLRNRNRNPRINQRLPPRRNHSLLGAVDIIASREGGAPRRGAGGLGEFLDEEGGLGLRDGGDCWSGHVVVVVVRFGSFGDWGGGLGGRFVCGGGVVGGGGGSGRWGRLLGHDMNVNQYSGEERNCIGM